MTCNAIDQVCDHRNIQVSFVSQYQENKHFHETKSGSRSPGKKPKETKELIFSNGCTHSTSISDDSRKSRVHNCTQNGKVQNAYEEFQDRTALLQLLKTCGKQKDLHKGSSIHADIIVGGLLERDITFGNALLSMYAKCGALAKAHRLFDQLPERDIVTWNALLSGYAQHGHGNEALNCFKWMQEEGVSPDAITYICLLKACGSIRALEMGEEIHADLGRQGLLENNVALGTALVDMYVRCGELAKARAMFDRLPSRDVVAWNVLIAGYAHNSCNDDALSCFQQMQDEGLSPNAITFVCTLKACGNAGALEKGEEIHAEVDRHGLLKANVVLGTALVDMYSKCGVLFKAQNVLAELPVWDVVSWNTLIAGYVQQGQGQEALGCFQQMRSKGLRPNAITYACILKACSITQNHDMGKQMHNEIASQGLLEKNVMLGNALIDMYAKCGVLIKAQKLFDELSVRDVISWNALIAGYAQHGQCKEALGCFQRMRSEGFSPEVVSWNALLGGYAQQGLAEETLDYFQWMQQEGTSPDAITFVSVLNACSHLGLLNEGQMNFDKMREKYGITANNEHYTCMVALYGHAGLFDEAMRLMKMMPSTDCPPVWSALLGACQKWGNVKLGRFAFERAVQLDGCNAVAYVLMSNIYVAAGMLEEAQDIECLRMENAVWKQP